MPLMVNKKLTDDAYKNTVRTDDGVVTGNVKPSGTAAIDKTTKEEVKKEYEEKKEAEANKDKYKPSQSASNSYSDYQNYSNLFKNGIGAYQESANVQNAFNYLQGILNNQPGAFTSQWTDRVNDAYNAIVNRDKFSYDVNSDALYQQYKDQYTRMGQTAMQDTVGQINAMNGGYGSSYAATAGNQAYNSYMSQLSDKIPELYQQALNQYNQEGENLLTQYSLARDGYENDYGQYRDQVSDYYTNLQNAYNAYRDERDTDYDKYLGLMSQYNTAANNAYSQYADQIDREYSQFVNDRNFALQKQEMDAQIESLSKYSGMTTEDRNKLEAATSIEDADDIISKLIEKGKISQEDANTLYYLYENMFAERDKAPIKETVPLAIFY